MLCLSFANTGTAEQAIRSVIKLFCDWLEYQDKKPTRSQTLCKYRIHIEVNTIWILNLKLFSLLFVCMKYWIMKLSSIHKFDTEWKQYWNNVEIANVTIIIVLSNFEEICKRLSPFSLRWAPRFLFKVNKEDARKLCKVCSKITMKMLQQYKLHPLLSYISWKFWLNWKCCHEFQWVLST